VAIIGFDPRVFDYLDAVAWVLFSGFVYGVSALLMRRLPGISPLTMQAWVALVSAPSLLAISLAIGEPGFAAAPAARWQAWAAVAYSAIGASLVGHAGMFYLLQRYPVAQITPYTMLVPLVALAAGVLLLGDVVTPMILAGAAVTIAGVLIITRSDLATADSRHGAVRDH
ncbi:MAG: EamA family transporter, partial [Alphaproteobacteria bacterium]